MEVSEGTGNAAQDGTGLNEDISAVIQLHLQEIAKDGYISAQQIVDFIATEEMQKIHEHDNIVQYRKEFIKRMITYDSETGKPNNTLQSFSIPRGQQFQLILSHLKETPKAQLKDDFLTSEWSQLMHEGEEAQVLFKTSASQDGWFKAEVLIAQVDKAIDIFKAKTNGFTKCTADALSAWKMSKSPNQKWTHLKDGSWMHNRSMSDGTSQEFYFPKDHPTMLG
ncbi:hypothetical protein ARMSODRAFT_987773 [Armillaria solidipes]|uniref:Uncharacterized protein n=1 Tax=Armillaria solidipes TaxID=1076256 RepID=A0A2H3BWQ7_9AGAR|nr:hypothetical protein ARMSODRAFT_987773 [Armillaria solidipes]